MINMGRLMAMLAITISPLVICVMSVPQALAQSPPAATPEKPPLQVLVGMNKPPYVQIETSDGFELELLREVVQRMGYRAEFTHVPNKRIQTLLQQGIGDIATLQPTSAAESELFYSCPYIR